MRAASSISGLTFNSNRSGCREDGRASDNIALGIVCMIGATFMFAASSAIMKVEVGRYPLGETMAARSLASLVVCAAAVLPTAGLQVFATQRPMAHVARGLSQATSQTFTVIALGLMPLAGAVAIGFSAPLFAAAVSILWLRERADAARLLTLGLGFIGVLVVARLPRRELPRFAPFLIAESRSHRESA